MPDALEAAPDAAAQLVQVDGNHLAASGSWTTLQLCGVEAQIQALPPASDAPLALDARGLTGLDSAGAWLLQTLLSRGTAGPQADAPAPLGVSAAQGALLARVAQRMQRPDGAAGSSPAQVSLPSDNPVQALGRITHDACLQMLAVEDSVFKRPIPSPWRPENDTRRV